MEVEHSKYWLTTYLEYLNKEKLPLDRILANMIQHQSSYFYLFDRYLYRCACSSPLLKCLFPLKASYVLWEAYEGICDNHMGAQS